MKFLDFSAYPKFNIFFELVTNSLTIVIVFVAVQTCFLIVLVLYMVYLRLSETKKKELRKLQNEKWYDMVFSYLEAEITMHTFSKNIYLSEFRAFGDFLKSFLLDLEGEEKEKIITLLQYIGYPEFLVGKLTHKKQSEKTFALYFFGLMKCDSYIKKVRNILDDPNEFNKFLAASVLMQVKDINSLELIFRKFNSDEYREHIVRLTTIFTQFGSGILPELHKIFKYQVLADWLIIVCLRVFRLYSYFDAQADIINIYQSTKSDEIRFACLNTLKVFENPELATFFEKQLDQPSYVIKQISASALGLIGDEGSLKKLIKLLYTNDFWVLKETIDAISKFEGAGMDILMQHLMHSKNELSRNLILESIKNI